jgi:sigma-B regulation protein RsbU (phosphoserine phosphatase)
MNENLSSLSTFHLTGNKSGGDLFDLVGVNGETFILMGDATGHGLGPAFSARQMQAMFRVAFRIGA